METLFEVNVSKFKFTSLFLWFAFKRFMGKCHSILVGFFSTIVCMAHTSFRVLPFGLPVIIVFLTDTNIGLQVIAVKLD